MRLKSLYAASVLLVAAFIVTGSGNYQSCAPITAKQLREMATQLGYEVKDIVTDVGKEKFSVTLTREGLDIPVAAELSGNLKFVWLTVNLGNVQPENAARHLAMLKQNSIIQPCQFYFTEQGRQMMGLPVENRGINNAFLRDRLENIAGRVGETKAMWQ